MDWTITGKDSISKIEIYFNDNGEKLISRLSKIIDMFEVQKTKRTEEDFKMEFTPIIIDVSKAIGVEFNASPLTPGEFVEEFKKIYSEEKSFFYPLIFFPKYRQIAKGFLQLSC